MRIEITKNAQLIQTLDYLNEDLVNGNEVLIGRSSQCHIVLDDHQVSREHLSIRFENNNFIVKNLSPYSSVIKSGKEINAGEEGTIESNDRVVINSFELKFFDLGNELNKNKTEIDDDKTQILPDETQILDPETKEDNDVTQILNSEFGEPPKREIDSEELSGNDQQEDRESFESSNSFEEEGAAFESDEPAFSEDNAFETQDDSFSSEDGFGENSPFSESTDSGESTQVFKSFAKYYLVLDGEFAPFDKYLIEDSEILIGRNPKKCQIYLNDSEVSGVHAVIKKSLINCVIEDQNSSNGTIYNGSRVNKTELVNGDSFQIGSTLFRVEIASELIESESDRLMPVADGQFVEVEQVVEEEVDFANQDSAEGDFGVTQVQEKSLIKRIMKDPKKKRIVIFGTVGLVLLMLLSEDDNPPPKKTDTKKVQTDIAKSDMTKKTGDVKDQLSQETLEKLEENYLLALSKFEAGEYYAAKEYLEVIRGIAPEYKDTQTLSKLVEEGLRELLKQKAKEEEEKERKARQLKIEAILEKARSAVEKREVAVAESLFSQVLEIDPENIDIPQLKLVIDAYKAEIEKKKNEEIRIKELRKSMVDALAPGKALFLKEEWFKAIDRLGKFTKKKGMDEDLVKEATDMIKESKTKLSEAISPLLGQARSLKEGQDLKRSYEKYGEILKFDPSHEEALNERDKIFEELRIRSMKLFREALISENLSLFEEARDQFKEVQQISPINSEYYNKASEKLKDYLE